MADKYSFRDHILNEEYEDASAPTDPTCEALPFLWEMVHEGIARGTPVKSLRALAEYACTWATSRDYTREQLRHAASLLWHRYKADVWLQKHS